MNKRKYIFYVIAFCTGLAQWVVIPLITGNPEAWGSSIYYKFGMPLETLECCILSYYERERWWHWGTCIIISQALFMIVKWPTSNLLPPMLVFLIIVSVPYLFGGLIGALIRKRVDRN
jgi:hypothetical protein